MSWYKPKNDSIHFFKLTFLIELVKPNIIPHSSALWKLNSHWKFKSSSDPNFLNPGKLVWISSAGPGQDISKYVHVYPNISNFTQTYPNTFKYIELSSGGPGPVPQRDLPPQLVLVHPLAQIAQPRPQQHQWHKVSYNPNPVFNLKTACNAKHSFAIISIFSGTTPLSTWPSLRDLIWEVSNMLIIFRFLKIRNIIAILVSLRCNYKRCYLIAIRFHEHRIWLNLVGFSVHARVLRLAMQDTFFPYLTDLTDPVPPSPYLIKLTIL